MPLLLAVLLPALVVALALAGGASANTGPTQIITSATLATGASARSDQIALGDYATRFVIIFKQLSSTANAWGISVTPCDPSDNTIGLGGSSTDPGFHPALASIATATLATGGWFEQRTFNGAGLKCFYLYVKNNTGATQTLNAWVAVETPQAPSSGGSGGTVTVANFPATQDVACVSGCSASSGTVSFSADDSERLDLTWWGVWALVGLAAAGLIGSQFTHVWRWWRDG